MGDTHLLAHGGQRRTFIIRKPHGQDRHMGEPADMDVLPAAIFRLLAARIFGEKIPVTLFQISIPVLSRGGHELEITPQIIRTVIAPARAQGLQQLPRQLHVHRVLPRGQKLMVMHAPPPPIRRLIVQNFTLGIRCRIA